MQITNNTMYIADNKFIFKLLVFSTEIFSKMISRKTCQTTCFQFGNIFKNDFTENSKKFFPEIFSKMISRKIQKKFFPGKSKMISRKILKWGKFKERFPKIISRKILKNAVFPTKLCVCVCGDFSPNGRF